MSRNLTTETCAPPTGLKTAEIISIFLETGREKIFSRDLASILRYGRDGLRSLALKDSAFDEYAISKLLRPYGVKPATIRIGTEVNKGGSSTFVMGKGEAVGSQKADRGLAVGCRLSPHPGLLPRGEGRRFAAGVELESGPHPSRRRFSCQAGSVFLSPRGRAGVRGNGAWLIKRRSGLGVAL